MSKHLGSKHLGSEHFRPEDLGGIDDLRLRKLRWLCRRGMKELDVLLERFLANQSLALQQGAWPEMEALLAMEDDQLWDFMQNPGLASNDYQSLLLNISHGTAQRT